MSKSSLGAGIPASPCDPLGQSRAELAQREAYRQADVAVLVLGTLQALG